MTALVPTDHKITLREGTGLKATAYTTSGTLACAASAGSLDWTGPRSTSALFVTRSYVKRLSS